MSFTNDLKAKGAKARAFFEEHFPDVAAARAALRLQVANAETLEPAEKDGYPWGTVGVAVDYRLRLCFPAAADLPSRWDVWSANPDIPFALMAGDPGLSKALVAERGASTSAIGGEGSPWVRAAGPSLAISGSSFGRCDRTSVTSTVRPRTVCAVFALCSGCTTRFTVSWGLERDAATWPQPGGDDRRVAQPLHTGGSGRLVCDGERLHWFAATAGQRQCGPKPGLRLPRRGRRGPDSRWLLYRHQGHPGPQEAVALRNGPGRCSATRSWTTTTVTGSAAWGCTWPGSRSS